MTALSVVGHGLVAWLTDHGPATLDLMTFHFAEADDIGPTHMAQIIAGELRYLESLGHVRRVDDHTDHHLGRIYIDTLWAAVAQPATTIHIQRPTEKPL